VSGQESFEKRLQGSTSIGVAYSEVEVSSGSSRGYISDILFGAELACT
jgi:hypothetical protein